MTEYLEKRFIEENKLTQNEVVLLHLIKNDYITNKQASDNYGFHHLPGIIRNLKVLYGCKFENIKQRNVFNRYKQKTEFDEYHLKNRTQIQEILKF